MLPVQAHSAIQTDTLPTQNLGLLDQNQSQVYSILLNSDSPNLVKKARRQRSANFYGTRPVVVNPQITRTPTGVDFTAPHQRSTSVKEPTESFLASRIVTGHKLLFKQYSDPSLCDANNNINNNHILPLSRTLNPTLPTHVQQIPTSSSSVANVNPVTKAQLFDANPLLNHTTNERAVPVSLLQQNGYDHFQSSYIFSDEDYLARRSSSTPSPRFPMPMSDTPSIKPKRKYSRKPHTLAFSEQQQIIQQTCPYPINLTQPNVSNNLPPVIPASMPKVPTISEEHPLLRDVPTPSNFAPQTPSGAIKSSITNNINELPLIPSQQYLLPFIRTNTAEMNQISNHYLSIQPYTYMRQTISNAPINNLPYHSSQFLPTACTPYCMVASNLMPTNILPMARSSMLRENVISNPSVSTPLDRKTERRKQERNTPKAETMQIPTIERLKKETSEVLMTDASALKKSRHRSSSAKDLRIKKQLRHITRLNRLAVFKFMMRKRKQQKQQALPTSQLSQTEVEQVTSELGSTSAMKREETETSLPDIIAPSLKISFDATQRIETISLYYHRRRKPVIMAENSSTYPFTADNRLGLLVEAMELVETLNSSLKLSPSSTN